MLRKSNFPVKRHKARKNHKCCNCYGTILIGATYNSQKFHQYGRFGIDKWHKDCDNMSQSIDNLKSSFKELFKKILNVLKRSIK